MRVSPEFFDTLGIGAPVWTRVHRRGDDLRRPTSVAILTDAYWRQHFGADRGRASAVPFGSTAVRRRSSACCHRRSASCRREPGSICRWRPVPTSAVRPPAFGQLLAHDRAAATRRHRRSSRRHSSMPTTPSWSRRTAGEDDGRRRLPIGRGVAARDRTWRPIRPTLLLLQAGALFLLLIGAVNVTNLLLIRASSRAQGVGGAAGDRRGAPAHRGGGRCRDGAAHADRRTRRRSLGCGRHPPARPSWAADVFRLARTSVSTSDVAVAAMAACWRPGLRSAFRSRWYSLRNDAAPHCTRSRAGSRRAARAQRLRHAFLVTQIALSFVLLSGAGLLAAA